MTDFHYDLAEPRADALIESLRSFGYSPESAVADLVDNSVSAKARHIDVHFEWAGRDSWVKIADDGAGMDEKSLLNAMRPGSTNPLEARSAEDLGRFGLGLKTASFSQARELTVISRRAGAPSSTRRWDLDVVAETHEWRLLRSAPADAAVDATDLDSHGTVVLWSKCDRLVGDVDADDSSAQRHFLSIADRVAKHLGATFHQFMVGRGKVTISLNGRPIGPWDPFMQSHPATMKLPSETLPLNSQGVTVTPFVLPHRSKLDSAAQASGAGLDGWNAHQGFYLYRGGRLLVMGDWLATGGARDEHSKLARIKVEFPPSLDLAWQVDVKKSSARVPSALREDFRRIARATRNRAEEVYRHRGKIMTSRTERDFIFAWHQLRDRDGNYRYELNRKHPVIQSLLESARDRSVVTKALRFIEETIPTTLIGVSVADALDNQPVPFHHHPSEVAALLDFVHGNVVQSGFTPAEAFSTLTSVDPFVHHPEVLAAFEENL